MLWCESMYCLFGTKWSKMHVGPLWSVYVVGQGFLESEARTKRMPVEVSFLSVPIQVVLSVSVSVSLSLSFSLSLSLSLSLSMCLCVSLSFSLSLSLCMYITLYQPPLTSAVTFCVHRHVSTSLDLRYELFRDALLPRSSLPMPLSRYVHCILGREWK